MFCDANGNPNPNGDFQMIDGKLIMRPGRRLHFDITMMRDSASRSTGPLADAAAEIAAKLTYDMAQQRLSARRRDAWKTPANWKGAIAA